MEWTSPSGTTARLRWRDGSVRSQAARGSAAAFTAVYERHHRALYRYCRSLLGDDEEARDALQSTMAKAFAALRFEERDFELRPWLFRIAHNEAVSRLRQRRDAVQLDVVDALTTDSLAQAVEVRERLAQLRADLEDLSERQRSALVMRELSGLGHAEIAAVLGGSPQMVKQTIFEARSALHECAEGRGMSCAEVQRILSDGDGRILRGRRMRAHVRACRACREFKAALAERPADLAALAPAPHAAIAATWLSRLFAATGSSSAGGASWVAGTLTTKAVGVLVATATVAGTATAVREATSHPAPTPRSHHAAERAAAAPHAGSRAAQPPSLVSSRPASGGRPSHGGATTVRAPMTTVAAAKPSAIERPATAASGGTAESAKKASHPAHPSSGQPASKPHGARKAASASKHIVPARHPSSKSPASAKRAHGDHAVRAHGERVGASSGSPRPVPPGQAKPAHAGGAKPAAAGGAPPATAGAGAPGDAAAGAAPGPGASGRVHGSK